jgi:hypothetical protein
VPQKLEPLVQQQDLRVGHNDRWHEDEQPWQHQNAVQQVDKPMPQNPGLVGENLFSAGDPREDMQLHSPSAQLQESCFEENSGQTIAELHIVEYTASSTQQFSFHGNPVQLMPIARGIKKVTKKKKKKRPKPKPALDISTLPQVIFDTPFEELGSVIAASNQRPELYHDQQQGLVPQPSVFTRADHAGETQVSDAAPALCDRQNHDNIIEIMDLDHHKQLQETHDAPTHIVNVDSTQLTHVSQQAGAQTSPETDNHQLKPQYRQPQQAAPSFDIQMEQELGFHQSSRHQETEVNNHHKGVQSHAPHLLLPKISYVDEHISHRLQAHQSHLQHDDESNKYGREIQHRTPRHTQQEELFHADEHVLQDLNSEQNHHQQDDKGDNHYQETQHHAPRHLQPETTHVNEPASQDFSAHQTQDQQIRLVHEHNEQVQNHAQPSQSVKPIPQAGNAQPSIRRQGAQPPLGRPKSHSRRSSKQQVAAHAMHSASPVVNVSTTTLAVSGTNAAHATAINEPRPAQAHSVADAFDLLRLTLQQDLQATTAKENKAKKTLQSQVNELKVSEAGLQAEVNIVKASKEEAIEKSKQDRKKLEANTERLMKLHKFTNGINNDLAKEKQNAKALHQQITELVNEGKVNATERKQFHEQLSQAIETSKTVQRKFVKELTNARLLVQKLELEKVALEKELREKDQLLEDERDQRLRLADDIRLQAVDQQLIKQLINESSSSLIQKLSEFQTALTESYDTITSKGVVELLQLVNGLQSRNYASSDDFKELGEQVNSFQNR